MDKENFDELELREDSLVEPLGDCRFAITNPGEEPRNLCFRIRKLTPRECFRLMDVDDEQIDAIQRYEEPEDCVLSDWRGYPVLNEKGKEQRVRKGEGISNSQQYKMAGNSIVVSCLEEIFEQVWWPAAAQSGQQLTLF